jgi:hypothetical protein
MLKAIYCFFTGQHEYGVACEPGTIFLRCQNCGQRSNGWAVRDQSAGLKPARVEVLAQVDPRVAHVHQRAA